MKCPKCGEECERDEVDVGVGSVPTGPWGCPNCHWVETRASFEEECEFGIGGREMLGKRSVDVLDWMHEHAGDSFKVQARQCTTCIYRPDSPLDLRKLEAAIADPRMPGHFESFRVCHHSDDACCRGFWDRHRDDFQLGQVAQRLGAVRFVDDDKERR